MENRCCLPSFLFLFFQSRGYSLVWLASYTLCPSIPAVVCSHGTMFKKLTGVVEVMQTFSRLVLEGTVSSSAFSFQFPQTGAQRSL